MAFESGRGALVALKCLVGGAEPGEGFRVLDAGIAHRRSGAGIREQVTDAMSEIDGVVGVHKAPGFAFDDVSGKRADGRRDDGSTAGHCFQGDKAKAFVERGDRAEVSRGVEVDQLLLGYGGVPRDSVGHTQVRLELDRLTDGWEQPLPYIRIVPQPK